MEDIAEEDVPGSDPPGEEDKMMSNVKDNIPRTGGFVIASAKTPWREVLAKNSKLLLPFRSVEKDDPELPAEKVGCCSFTWIDWMTKPMIRAYKHGLTSRDLFQLSPQDQAKYNGERLQRIWEEEQAAALKANRKPSLAKCIFRFGKSRFAVSSFLLIISIILQFLTPSLVLKLILDFVNDPSQNEWWGWSLVLILALALIVRAICFSTNFSLANMIAIRILGASQYLGFSKLLRLSSPNDSSMGQFITFCTGDQERIAEAVMGGVLIVCTPVMFIMAIIYTWFLVGPFTLLACSIVLLFYPIMGGLAALTSVLRLRVVRITDKRVTLMNEIVGAMRLIKMYAWEEPFEQRVLELRHRERKELQNAAFLQSISTSITPSITILAVVVTILVLTFIDFPLTAPIAFTLFSVFSALQFTIGTLPYSLRCITEAKVSFDRLQKLLEMPEFVTPHHEKQVSAETDDTSEKFSLVLEDASLAWEMAPAQKKDKKTGKNKGKKEKSKKKSESNEGEKEALVNENSPKFIQCLNKLNLKVDYGQLVGVSGHVGAGKSSLISAIMGEMKLLQGQVKVNGTFAVVPQQAWIFNGTLRDNILFGSDFDKSHFETVLDICALKADLENLPEGDQTLIGERGINLSGGQKQRVSLARALYASNGASIFLLDDPLSAVDPRVAKEIFEKCIDGFLRSHNKTVIFVSHGMQFLRQCDKIIFMKDGSIVESGTFSELMKTESQFKNLVSYEHQEKSSSPDGDSEPSQVTEKSAPVLTRLLSNAGPQENRQQNIMNQEEAQVYEAGWGVLLKYFKACGGYFITFLLYLAIFVFALSRLFTAVWLQIWLDAGDGREEERLNNSTETNSTLTDQEIKGLLIDNPDLWIYQLVYGLSMILLLLLGIVKAVSLAVRLLAGSSNLHDSMLKSILRAPTSFFDSTPTGVIINRFSKDMDELDVRIPMSLEFVSTAMFFCLTQIGMVCYVYPLFIMGLFVIVVAFLLLDLYMNRGVTLTKRLDNQTKSAIVQDISSIMPGIAVIRAFERQHVLQHQFDQNVNRNLSAQAMFRYSNRWFSLRMDLLGALTIVTTAAVAVGVKGTVSAAEAGLALANVFQVATFVPYVMLMKADFRARFNSVERVSQYAHDLPQEAPLRKPEAAPPSEWPKEGSITFDKVSLRYKEEQPQVLRRLSFQVNPGEKVGIVGRTGAGKSSLFAALLRLTELDEGRVVIDGVDVGRIGLNDLRSSVAVIPQDPVLFQGTLRYNLDPFARYDDDKLWDALERAHLKDQIVSNHRDSGMSEAGLDMNVETEGDNFSVGEKQLICLARALLRGNRILLLDEATASVDLKTDYLIQTAIKEAFSDCTVLTIAHRVNTILNYDKVIVMHKGEIVESGNPQDLMKDRDGIFYSMVAASKTGDKNQS